MEPLFKVGDVVRVKKRIGDEDDYKYGFIDDMAGLSRKEFTIEKVNPDYCDEEFTIPDDNAEYLLCSCRYTWSSGMLELVSREEPTRYQSKPDNDSFKITISKKNKLKLNFKL